MPQASASVAAIRLSRILVPVDFSPRSRGGVQYARALACHFHAQVILLHAVPPTLLPYGPAEPIAYSAMREMESEMLADRQRWLEDFLPGEWRNIPVERLVLTEDPARAIVDHAALANCDLIVMPTHGHGPFRRFLLGSVTAKVLHDSGCPVWTGPHLEDAPPLEDIAFRRILCAVDLGPDSGAVLRWAAGFAREFAAELAILHVLPISAARLDGMYFSPEWHADETARSRERVAALASEAGVEVETMIETGDVPDIVSNAASVWKADLLVIGRGRSAGVLGRLRANAYAILRAAACPVAAI
jgi:nucleotide-binding universal stress UspA family protein